jgi:GNAT superfamily N-acetyltransferase
MRVRLAQIVDAAAISALGARVFQETFAHGTAPDDMRQFLAETFQPALQAAEIADPSRTVFVAEADEQLAGFAMVRRGVSESSVAGANPMELQRLYVDKPWHGGGVAQALMEQVFATARESGCDTLWLGVWERNFRAQRFYAKYGFKVCGSHVFPVGKDPQIDLILSVSVRT